MDSSNPCTGGDDFYLDGSVYEDVSKKVNVNKNIFRLVYYVCKYVNENRLIATKNINGAAGILTGFVVVCCHVFHAKLKVEG